MQPNGLDIVPEANLLHLFQGLEGSHTLADNERHLLQQRYS
jgi:hypothetical protein